MLYPNKYAVVERRILTMATLEEAKPEDVGILPGSIDRLKQRAEDWVKDGFHPSLIILAARRGKIFLHESYGQRAPDEDILALSKDTIFPLASISKLFTASAVLLLVEDGLLSLNRQVQTYIPEFQGDDKDKVTLHHLLTHTSGLKEEFIDELASKFVIPQADLKHLDEIPFDDIRKMIMLACKAPLSRQPGAVMSYSNYGYSLLGEIIRRVSGQTLHEFTSERLFQPLGMKDTWFSVPESAHHRVVRRPENAEYHQEYNSTELMLAPHAWGGAYSTALDMATFCQMFLNLGSYGDSRILSPASIRAMTRNQVPGIRAEFHDEELPDAEWGLGWSVQDTKKSRGYGEFLSSKGMICHGGSGGSFIMIDPAQELLLVYFSVSLQQEYDWLPIRNVDLAMNMIYSAIAN
jgi:CubicO group peptidase (beta-lactamase class C family)